MRSRRQPWPMKWIVLVIVLGIGAYTYLTLHYRKPGPAFRPYADLKDRANTRRLLSAGYQRIALDADLPTDSSAQAPAAAVAAADAGLPPSLQSSLVDMPTLPAEIISVSAAGSASSMFAYPISFKCTLPDNRLQLAGAALYVRGDEIVVAPDFDRLAGGLLSRTRESLVRVTVPAGTLKPGSYRVTLVGAHASRAWSLQVH
ncbi:MAG: hypothetical protein JWM88_1062 [Verrucomicrobia bacterium]|nr:hypothetical protein [Verrucomicrobiota bacterium]